MTFSVFSGIMILQMYLVVHRVSVNSTLHPVRVFQMTRDPIRIGSISFLERLARKVVAMLATLEQMVGQSHGLISQINNLFNREWYISLLNRILCYKVFLITCKIMQGSSTTSQYRFYADCNCSRLFWFLPPCFNRVSHFLNTTAELSSQEGFACTLHSNPGLY